MDQEAKKYLICIKMVWKDSNETIEEIKFVKWLLDFNNTIFWILYFARLTLSFKV